MSLAQGSSRAPHFHVSPSTGFSNDPQRPLWSNGVWNLWLLWNGDYPTGNGTAWRRFTSTDLVKWSDAGVSIPKYTTSYGDVWTGSTVLDTNNSAGHGAGAVIAILTMPCDNTGGTSGQNQSSTMWYSTDGGKTFSFDSIVLPNYPGGNSAFRDPSVFWHAPTSRWVLSLAEVGKLSIYTSTHLRTWTYKSALSNSSLGQMECPNLFKLHLYNADGTTSQDKWVLLCGANGSSAGLTSGTYYWSGCSIELPLLLTIRRVSGWTEVRIFTPLRSFRTPTQRSSSCCAICKVANQLMVPLAGEELLHGGLLIHEVDDWRNGLALIPAEWMQ